MSSRIPNPGENNVFDLIDQRGVKNRTLRGQITGVGNADGFVTVGLESSPAGGKQITVPPLWMSFPQSAGAAWGRYMPHVSDIVKVSFDFDDTPHIVGYDIVASKSGVADGKAGWPQLNEMYTKAKDNPSATVSVSTATSTTQAPIAKFAQFTPLSPGEYDFMSSGGAYIYGNANGRLYLAGGSVSISLSKNDMLIEQRSQTLTHYADDCEYRYGQVRRPNTTEIVDTQVTADSAGSFKELSAVLKTTTAPGVTLDLARIQLGNVVIDTGTTTEVLDGNALRYLMRTHNQAGQLTFETAVDELGNMRMQSSTAAGQVKMDFPQAPFTGNFNTYTINSPSINFQGASGQPSASHPLILSNTYRTSETNMITAMAKHIMFLHTQLTAVVALLNSAGGLAAPPVGGAIAMGAAFVAGATPITSSMSAYAATPDTAAASSAKFIAAYDTFLSQIAKTG